KDEYLRYDQALAAGWPIATGVIEGACRHLIGDRLDITGARWGLDGAEAILTLRAVLSNGDFGDYWRYHLAREHQRLYPGTTQGRSLSVALPHTPTEPHPSSIESRRTMRHGSAWSTDSSVAPQEVSKPRNFGRGNPNAVQRACLSAALLSSKEAVM